MKMATNVPARKVVVSTLAAAISTVLIWLLKTAMPDLVIPQGVESAITTILVFLVGYYTPPASRDQVTD